MGMRPRSAPRGVDAYTRAQTDSLVLTAVNAAAAAAATAAGALALTGGTLTGNLLFGPDAARDIGAALATRPRNVYTSGGLWVGAEGSTVLHSNAADELTLNASAAGGTVCFRVGGADRWKISNAGILQPAVDNTYDIGNVATFRPRRLFLSDRLFLGLAGAAAGSVSIDFGNAYVAPAAVAVTFGAVGPTGAATGNQKGWLPVTVNGVARWIPFW